MSETRKIPDPLITTLTPVEYYYLLRRFASTLTVWNAQDLNMPSTPSPVIVNGVNPHMRVVNRVSCVTLAPVDLYSHERVDGHAFQAVFPVIFHVVKELKWNRIELTGMDFMERRAKDIAEKYNVTVLRSSPRTEKEQKVFENMVLREEPWMKPSQTPGQVAG